MSFPLTPSNGDYFNTFEDSVFRYNLSDNMWFKLTSNNKEIYNISEYSKYLKNTDDYDKDLNTIADLNKKYIKELPAPEPSVGVITLPLTDIEWDIVNTLGTPDAGSLVIYNQNTSTYIGKFINGINIFGFEIGDGESVTVDTDNRTLLISESVASESDVIVVYSNTGTDLQFDTGFGFYISAYKDNIVSETILDVKDISGTSVFKIEANATDILLNSVSIATMDAGINKITLRFFSADEYENTCYYRINDTIIGEVENTDEHILNYVDVLTLGLEEDFSFSKFGKIDFYDLYQLKDYTSFPLAAIASSASDTEANPDTVMARDGFGKSKVATAESGDPDTTIVNKGYADAIANSAVLLTGDQTIEGIKTFSSTVSGSIDGNSETVTNGVYTAGDQTIGGNKTFSLEVTAPSFNATSSRAVKRDIEEFKENAIDIIDSIEIVNFKYKDDTKDRSKRVGFIAEDVNSLYLTADGHHFDLGSSIGLLLKAVQELKQENIELKNLLGR